MIVVPFFPAPFLAYALPLQIFSFENKYCTDGEEEKNNSDAG